MKALITGISGFVGEHLSNKLIEAGAEVYGISRSRSGPAGAVTYNGDIRDSSFVKDVLRQIGPDHIFHLAGVIKSDDPMETYRTNVTGTAVLLQAVRSTVATARVLISSSSAVYDDSGGAPIPESYPLRPRDDYGASKAAQEMVAISYQSRGLNLARVRPFNLVGPGQTSGLVLSEIAQQIVDAERGGSAVLRIGNLSTKRDYLDVRDAATAYVAMARNHQMKQVYNLCSGVSRPISECLHTMLSLSKVPLRVEQEPQRLRPNDVREQVGAYSCLNHSTGWTPAISFEDSLADLLESFRKKEIREGTDTCLNS